jgi:hypothetical protein
VTVETTSVPWRRIEKGSWPYPEPPLAGSPITLRLLTDGPARQGRPYAFVIRIGNVGDEAVSLRPCPAYRAQYLPHVEVGYLNCEAAPDAIPPGGYLDFEMQIDVLDLDEPNRPLRGAYELLWLLGGEGFEGKSVHESVRLVP